MSTSQSFPDDHVGATHPAHDRDQEVTPGDVAVGVIVGRTVGFFDMFVFGIACVMVFPKVVFPFTDEFHGIIYSFLIFALGIVAQPIGSVAFFPVQRRYGRTTMLTIALFLLGVATVGMAFMPDYRALGWVTIAWLVVLRFVQGFAIGGSWNGLASLLALKSPPERRGWFAAIPQLSGPIGFILAAAIFVCLWAGIPHDEFIAWGWRYPFFAAFGVNMFALFARLRLVAAPEYEKQFKSRELAPVPVGKLLRHQGKFVALGAFAPLASYALFNLITIFALVWVLLFTTHSLTNFLVVQIIGAAVAIPCILISGWMADRMGRRVTLGIFAIGIAVYSGWTALLLSGGVAESYVFLIVGFALLGFSHAQSAGAVSSSFHRYFRYTGARISSDLGWLLGAGFAPVVALLLAHYLGMDYVGLYLLSGAIGTLAALWISRKIGGLPNT